MFDVNKVCRICLSEENPKLPIFKEGDQGSESEPTIPEKIMSFAKVTIGKDDGLPMHICVKCYCLVDTTVEFKRQCEESFNYFQRQHIILSKLRDISPALQIKKENSDSQPHILPADLINMEENEPEGGLPAPVSGERDSDETVTDTTNAEIEASQIQCHMLLDNPDMELDLSNIKIKNIRGNWLEELSSPTETQSENVQDYTVSINHSSSASENDKTFEYRDHRVVASDESETNFSLGFHQGCSSCSRHFQPNEEKDKDKDRDVCVNSFMETSVNGNSTNGTDVSDRIEEMDGYSTNEAEIAVIDGEMDRHSTNEAEVAVIDGEMDGNSRNEAEIAIIDAEMDGNSTNEAEIAVIDGDMDRHSTNEAEVAVIDGDMNRHSTNEAEVAVIDGDMNRHSTNEAEVAVIDAEMDGNSKNEAEVTVIGGKMNMGSRGLVTWTTGMSEAQMKCSLCNTVFCDEEYFKAHLKFVHPGYRIIYLCCLCKSRRFCNKFNCMRHLLTEHGIIANGNLKYKLVKKKSRKNAKNRQRGKLKNDSNKEVSELEKSSEKKTGGNPGKCSKQTHPPFCHKPPSFVRNNFDLTSTEKGVKRYVCRGCGATCEGYIGALKHYRIYRKNGYFH